MAPLGHTNSEELSPEWRLGAVRWRVIFGYQTWGQLLIILVGGIVTGASHFFNDPMPRKAYLYDAQASMDHSKKDTIPDALAAIYPWLMFLVTVTVVEFGVFYRKHSLTRALHAFAHTFFCCTTVFVLVLAMTEGTKPVASRLRPDFLDRCNPINKNADIEGNLDSAQVEAKCNPSTDKDELKDGRLSFPSGHSSNSMSVCWFCALYLVYSLYWREGAAYMGGLRKRRSCGMRFLMEICNALFYIWGVCVLALSWFIGVSRYHDNRHHVSDIIGGFVLGIILTTPYFLTYAGQLEYYARRIDEDELAYEGELGPVKSRPTLKGVPSEESAAPAHALQGVNSV